jgi:hypothetical protein
MCPFQNVGVSPNRDKQNVTYRDNNFSRPEVAHEATLGSCYVVMGMHAEFTTSCATIGSLHVQRMQCKCLRTSAAIVTYVVSSRSLAASAGSAHRGVSSAYFRWAYLRVLSSPGSLGALMYLVGPDKQVNAGRRPPCSHHTALACLMYLLTLAYHSLAPPIHRFR